MNKTHAMKKLLEHGPLDIRGLLQITGWSRKQIWNAITVLKEQDILTVQNIDGKRCYRLVRMYS